MAITMRDAIKASAKASVPGKIPIVVKGTAPDNRPVCSNTIKDV